MYCNKISLSFVFVTVRKPIMIFCDSNRKIGETQVNRIENTLTSLYFTLKYVKSEH